MDQISELNGWQQQRAKPPVKRTSALLARSGRLSCECSDRAPIDSPDALAHGNADNTALTTPPTTPTAASTAPSSAHATPATPADLSQRILRWPNHEEIEVA